MGRKLDAILGRNFKAYKVKAVASLAISRIAILKNQRQVRSNQTRSDVVQLLEKGHRDRALLRVRFLTNPHHAFTNWPLSFLFFISFCLLVSFIFCFLTGWVFDQGSEYVGCICDDGRILQFNDRKTPSHWTRKVAFCFHPAISFLLLYLSPVIFSLPFCWWDCFFNFITECVLMNWRRPYQVCFMLLRDVGSSPSFKKFVPLSPPVMARNLLPVLLNCVIIVEWTLRYVLIRIICRIKQRKNLPTLLISAQHVNFVKQGICSNFSLKISKRY